MNENNNSLELCKQASLTAENILFTKRLDFDVEYAGATYQADPASYSEIVAAAAQTQLPDNFYWIDKNNNKVAFLKSDIEQLLAIVFEKRFQLFSEHQAKKEKIRNAESVQQIFS
jgi:hypothetical protein